MGQAHLLAPAQPDLFVTQEIWGFVGAASPLEILQEVVDGSFSGGGYLGFDSIDELNSGDHVGQQLRAVQQPPSLRGGLHQLEDHRQAGRAVPLPLVRRCRRRTVANVLSIGLVVRR